METTRAAVGSVVRFHPAAEHVFLQEMTIKLVKICNRCEAPITSAAEFSAVSTKNQSELPTSRTTSTMKHS